MKWTIAPRDAPLSRYSRREFAAEGVFLQKAVVVADADVVVRAGKESGAVEIGTEHDEEVGAGAFVRRGGVGAEEVCCARSAADPRSNRTIANRSRMTPA